MINLTTGAATKVNTIGGGEIVRGATLSVADCDRVRATVDNKLVSFKPATPGTFDTTAAITGLQGGENIIGIDFRPTNGKLYAATSGGRVYTIDPTRRRRRWFRCWRPTRPIDDPFTAITGTNFGVDFNPVADRLRIVSDTGQSLRINVDTGATRRTRT